MALKTYWKKRDFDVTAEPRGNTGKRGGNAFVVQKHAATRLHYDLRLELAGVMKSWAVTRGPSLVPGDKRLAVEVEDHPIEYNKFEGTIPKGEYGGGTVMVWDRGTWHPEGDAQTGLIKGRLNFELKGKKLHGNWHLVRMHNRKGESRNNWLLIKSQDEFAHTAKAPDILEKEPRSVLTGRSMEEIAGADGAVWHSNRSTRGNATRLKSGSPAKKRQPARTAKVKAARPKSKRVSQTAPKNRVAKNKSQKIQRAPALTRLRG